MTIDTTSPHARRQAAGAGTVAGIALLASRWREGDALTAPGREPISYAELGRAIREIAGGLAALGIERGDHVAILAGTRPEWTLADLGALAPARPSSRSTRRTRPRSASTSSPTQASARSSARTRTRSPRSSRSATRCPALEHVIVFDGEAPGAVTLADLRASGAATGEAVVADRLARRRAGGRGDDRLHVRARPGHRRAASSPTPACWRRRRCMSASSSCRAARWSIYLFLPLAHSLARVAQYATLEAGGTLAFWGGDPKRIVDELAEIRPTHFPSVPRIYEKVHATVLNGVAEQGRRQAGALPLGARRGRRGAHGGARGHAARPRWPRARHRARRPARALEGARRVRRPARAWRCAAPPRSGARCSSSSTPAACSCSRAMA